MPGRSGAAIRKRFPASRPGAGSRRVLRQADSQGSLGGAGFKPKGSGRFFYPRRGFGQISEAYADAAKKLGAEFLMGWKVTRMDPPASDQEPWRIHAERNGETRVVEAEYVWSTIPITILARAISTGVPEAVKQAGKEIEYRSMILVYLELDVDQFTEYDAHYFPAANIRITRLSEPKNYAALAEPRGRTTLCAELPCSPEDPWWSMTTPSWASWWRRDLATAGNPPGPARPWRCRSSGLRQAYPIYTTGYEVPFGTLDHLGRAGAAALELRQAGDSSPMTTLTYALFMAYSAVDCLVDGKFDQDKWRKYREVFATHVVED
jgi:protoporphyrinogen oxidase